MVIPPTVMIQQQMRRQMIFWGTSFLDLSEVKVENLASTIQKDRPSILLSSIERIKDEEVQRALLTFSISYVAIDEAQVILLTFWRMDNSFPNNQVTDPEDGWTDFRAYNPEVWLHLRAAHNAVFLWSTATCSEASLGRITAEFSVLREEVSVLYMPIDRKNIYYQRRILEKKISIGLVIFL